MNKLFSLDCEFRYNICYIFRQNKARDEEKLRLDLAFEVPPVAPRTTSVNSSRPSPVSPPQFPPKEFQDPIRSVPTTFPPSTWQPETTYR